MKRGLLRQPPGKRLKGGSPKACFFFMRTFERRPVVPIVPFVEKPGPALP